MNDFRLYTMSPHFNDAISSVRRVELTNTELDKGYLLFRISERDNSASICSLDSKGAEK